MSDNKTKPSSVNPAVFIDQITSLKRRTDALTLLNLFSRTTGLRPIMWGTSIIGYGSYTYTLASGRQQTLMRTGFSPRKQHLVLYVSAGLNKYPERLNGLGKYKTGKACLYINTLDDVDLTVLEKIIEGDIRAMANKYPE